MEETIGGDSRLVTAEVAAEFLSVKPSTLAAWRHANVGPAFVKLSRGRSGAIRYSIAELKKFAADPVLYIDRPVTDFRDPKQ